MSLQVGFGGDTETTETRNTPEFGFTPWAQESFTFVAKSTSQVLSFMADGGPDGLPPLALIDGVSLSAVPLPFPSHRAGRC